MNEMIVAATVSIAIVLYAAFLLGNRTELGGTSELAAEEAICREIAADALNGSESLAAYMQTRCPARYLTDGASFTDATLTESPQGATP